MKKYYFAAPVFSAIALALELLPNGILMLFANPEGPHHKTYCSYFDLLPFGYANFAPLLTAVCTCIALIFAVICIIKPKRKLLLTFSIFSCLAFVLSLFITLSFYRATVINPLVSAALLISSIISILLLKKSDGGKL